MEVRWSTDLHATEVFTREVDVRSAERAIEEIRFYCVTAEMALPLCYWIRHLDGSDVGPEHTVTLRELSQRTNALVNRVEKTRLPITVTKNGQPVATLVPAKNQTRSTPPAKEISA